MDGVTILNTYSQLSVTASLILFLIGIVSGLGFLGGILCLCDDDIRSCIWGALICTGCLSFFIIWCIIMPRTEFIQATIDASVSWQELEDRYEITKAEGRIITMIEKEQKDETD